MKVVLFFLFFTSIHLFAIESLQQKLEKIDCISFEKIQNTYSFSECYKVFIKQPIDHDNPDKGFFYQKFYLSHKDFKKPTVFFIDGYVASRNKVNEWSNLLEANQVYVEHRYYGDSKPEKIDWKTLNLKNTTADLHRIKILLNKIYENSWICTGTSKGGLTSVAYKYYFPNDVKATIAHSTPVGINLKDTTVFAFIDSLALLGGCLEKTKSFQRKLLSNKSEIIPLLRMYLDSIGKRYEKIGLNRIYEIAVLEIPFSIWQNNSGCSAIPNNDNSSKALFESLQAAIYNWFLTDDIFYEIGSYHYQALTELGYYDYPTFEFRDLLTSGIEKPISRILSPKGIEIKYSNQLMSKIKKWLITSGNNIIYIYGGNDPYSFYRIQPSERTNSLALILNNCNHNQTRYQNLNDKEQIKIMNYLNEWIE